MPTLGDPDTLSAEMRAIYDAMQIEGANTVLVNLTQRYPNAVKVFDPMDVLFQVYDAAELTFKALVPGGVADMYLIVDGKPLKRVETNPPIEPFIKKVRWKQFESATILNSLTKINEYMQENSAEIVALIAP